MSPDMSLSKYERYERKNYLLDERYSYVSKLQEGSFGEVTLAIDITNNTNVAVKAMYKSKAYNIAKHEIKMLAKLGKGCDHICQLLNSFETEDFVILILQYCERGDLYDLIHSSNLISSFDIWKIAKEMASGLSYAHKKGIYHRDIKPENVLFDVNGQVKLCDWGLSTLQRWNREFNVGTDKYMAPECFIKRSGIEEYDAKMADYWSLGVTVLTAVFGTSPFKPVGESKSVEFDSNFKNFVHCNNHEVLYDIYPMMSQNCFNAFMNLLKIGGVDNDNETCRKVIGSRSLKNFVHDLQHCWQLGLTIDEEYELELGENNDGDVFYMDHEDLKDSNVNETEFEFDTETENNDSDSRYVSNTGAISVESYQPVTMPSLVESSTFSSAGKSWCDLDDDKTFEDLFTSLSVGGIPNKEPTEKFRSKGFDVVERYLGEEVI